MGSAHENQKLIQVDLMAYTESIGTDIADGWRPNISEFEISVTFDKAVETAIKKAKKSKATGTDEMFVEALQLKLKLFSKLICGLD